MAAESKYQAKLKKQYEEDGWLVIRMITATTTEIKSGVPDLLALKPNGDGTHQIKFIEVNEDDFVGKGVRKELSTQSPGFFEGRRRLKSYHTVFPARWRFRHIR